MNRIGIAPDRNFRLWCGFEFQAQSWYIRIICPNVPSQYFFLRVAQNWFGWLSIWLADEFRLNVWGVLHMSYNKWEGEGREMGIKKAQGPNWLSPSNGQPINRKKIWQILSLFSEITSSRTLERFCLLFSK